MANHVCPWWLAYTFDNPLRTFFHKPDQMLSQYVKEGMTVADIGLTEPIDFALTFWMVHEIPDKQKILGQIHAILKDSGLLLIAEPKFHVSRSQFEQEKDIAREVGFTIKDEPKITFSHSVLLEKAWNGMKGNYQFEV